MLEPNQEPSFGDPNNTDVSVVEQLVNISKKVHDQLVNEPRYAEATFRQITSESACNVELVECDNRKIQQTPPAYGQRKIRREYLLKLMGTPYEIENAKMVILRTLKPNDTEERVSLKMDVSFSDHSFVIGRRGRGIQIVMRDTKCHIHFPDSNRNHEYEKSNQVSIAGAPHGVAEARRQIRELLPISFAFLIRNEHYLNAFTTEINPQFPPLEAHPVLRQSYKECHERLQNEYNVTIMVLPIPKVETAVVTVRGRHANITRIKKATNKLMHNLLPGCPPAVVFLGIEVSPHHLDFVQGHEGCNINKLLKETNTELNKSETQANRHQIPTLRISGQIDNVYEAWVKIMDLLPLALLVDIPASSISGLATDKAPMGGAESSHPSFNFDSDNFLSKMGNSTPTVLGAYNIDDVASKLNEMLYDYDISLTTRQKNREVSQWLLVMKGPEKNVDLMFQIYQALKTDDPVEQIRAAIGQSPSADSSGMDLLSRKGSFTSQTTAGTSEPFWDSSTPRPLDQLKMLTPVRRDIGFRGSPFASSANAAWRSDGNFSDRVISPPSRQYNDNTSRNRTFEHALASPSFNVPTSPTTTSFTSRYGTSFLERSAPIKPRTLFSSANDTPAFDERFPTPISADFSTFPLQSPSKGNLINEMKYNAAVGSPAKFSSPQRNQLLENSSRLFASDTGISDSTLDSFRSMGHFSTDTGARSRTFENTLSSVWSNGYESMPNADETLIRSDGDFPYNFTPGYSLH